VIRHKPRGSGFLGQASSHIENATTHNEPDDACNNS
jgi:hypothetical protein